VCPTETPLGGPAELARQGRARVSGTIFSTASNTLQSTIFNSNSNIKLSLMTKHFHATDNSRVVLGEFLYTACDKNLLVQVGLATGYPAYRSSDSSYKGSKVLLEPPHMSWRPDFIFLGTCFKF
jgi:hypothetical protein